MFVVEKTKADGAKETRAVKQAPKMHFVSKDLFALMEAADTKLRFDLAGKVTVEELNAALDKSRKDIAKDYIAKHGMQAACGEGFLSREEALQPRQHRGQLVQDLPREKEISPQAASQQADDNELYKRYLVAVCHLGHGEFDDLDGETLQDVAGLVPQKRYGFQKFKKSLGA